MRHGIYLRPVRLYKTTGLLVHIDVITSFSFSICKNKKIGEVATIVPVAKVLVVEKFLFFDLQKL